MVRSVVEDGPVHGCQSTDVHLLQPNWPYVAGGEGEGEAINCLASLLNVNVHIEFGRKRERERLTGEEAEGRMDSRESLTSAVQCDPVTEN